jgi:2-polyprenyl-3-methyl-5-hydroxy-6-metoxy-1,4-benzoquinol methylase
MVERKPVSPDVYTDEYYLGCSSGHDRFEESRGLYVPPLIFSIVEHADIQAGQRVLDLGCGRGEVAFNLAALGASAIGLDYASSALKLATAMREEHPDLAERVALAKGDAKQLPFRSSSFDAAFMLDVVEHLQPWELHLALVEVRRLLKPSGALYIHTMPNLRFYRYVYPVLRVVGRVAQGTHLPRDPRSEYEHSMHVNEQTPRSLRGALDDAGFDPRVWVSDYVRPVLKPGTLHRLASGVGKRRPLRAIAAFNVFAEARPR